MNWKLFDEVYASVARPTSVIFNGLALAFATCWTAVHHPDVLVVTVGASGAVVGAVSYFRTMDKKAGASTQTGAAAPQP